MSPAEDLVIALKVSKAKKTNTSSTRDAPLLVVENGAKPKSSMIQHQDLHNNPPIPKRSECYETSSQLFTTKEIFLGIRMHRMNYEGVYFVYGDVAERNNNYKTSGNKILAWNARKTMRQKHVRSPRVDRIFPFSHTDMRQDH